MESSNIDTSIMDGVNSNDGDETWQVLKAAAYLDSFDIRLLQAATLLQQQEIDTCLRMACTNGVIISQEQQSAGSRYSFLDGSFLDGSQETVYRLVPQEERNAFHACLAKNLIQNLSEQELETHYHTVLLQFHRGAQHIIISSRQNERNEVAMLCLKAIQWAVAASDLPSARTFADFGIAMLGSNCWQEEYDLTLALWNASAEVMSMSSDYDKMDLLVLKVLKNAHCYQHTIRVHLVHVHSLNSRRRFEEAIQEGLDVLNHLGEQFPKRPTRFHVALAYARTKSMLFQKTNAMILRIPLMTDPDKIAACQMLNVMSSSAFRVLPELAVLCRLRLVQLTMRFGLSAVSSVGFAIISTMMCRYSQDKKEGFRYGKLALELIEEVGGKEWIPRVFVSVYGDTFTYKYPLEQVCRYLLVAHQTGLETGDIEFAMIASMKCLSYMLSIGQPIPEVEVLARRFYQEAVARKQETALCMMRPFLQYIYIMMGISDDKMLFQSDNNIEKETKPRRKPEQQDDVSIGYLHFLKMLPAYLFHDYEKAAEHADQMDIILNPAYLQPGIATRLVCQALAFLGIVENRNGCTKRRLIKKAKRNLKVLKRFASCTPENCLCQTYLVQAELARVTGNDELAKVKYISANAVSLEAGNLGIRAVSLERFASFLLANNDESSATEYFRQAHLAYQKWGAAAKVEHMENEMPELFASSTDSK